MGLYQLNSLLLFIRYFYTSSMLLRLRAPETEEPANLRATETHPIQIIRDNNFQLLFCMHPEYFHP